MNYGHNSRFLQDTIAIVYDFDGTLSPQPMHDYTVLPSIGMAPAEFWDLVAREVEATGGERMLVYMRLLLEKAFEAKTPIRRRDFARMAAQIRYYPGVSGWFERINDYVKRQGRGKVKLRHYIISAGLQEILEGVGIRRHFSKVYASGYHFDVRGAAVFPAVVITDTTKTQYLFRINKGREDLRESINEHMPEAQRPIPFRNIIYIGDGITDVPSMAVTRHNGGHGIAVHDETRPGSIETCRTLLEAGRVDFIAPADYRAKSPLARRVRLLLDSVIAGIAYDRELFASKRRYQIDGDSRRAE
jgi:phosphoserine phosphatase